jgi:SAM-dependent methyltransferase
VPVLLSRASARTLADHLSNATGEHMLAEYASAAVRPDARSWQRRAYEWLRPPELLYHVDPRLEHAATRRLFDHRGPDTRVLNVGGGPTRYSENEITLNLRPFVNVDVVGDAHNIPFDGETFDSIVCNSVLEHVHDSERVVVEMLRVLRPGGYLYAEVPYIFFFHGYPNDFRRYTREGLKWLFADLEHCEVGVIVGPVSALLQSANSLLDILLPRRFPVLRKLGNGAFRYATFWMKYLDVVVNRRDGAHELAAGLYVRGRKRFRPDRGGSAGVPDVRRAW